MLVYRVCNKDEVEYILNNQNFLFVGGLFFAGTTHHYEKDYLYMHFFLNKRDILYMSASKDRCICTYDIPKAILDKTVGLGTYLDYINFHHQEQVLEFAIKSEFMKIEYLKQVDLLLDSLDYEDFFTEELDASKYKTIYGEKLIRVRKRK